jgi:hypothetical protein
VFLHLGNLLSDNQAISTMKKIYALLLSVAIVSLSTATSWAAEAQATEAKVLKITGSATVQLPGQSAAVALVEGMSLPVGSTITTGAGSEVQVQPFAGGLASIAQNSTVALDELSVNKDGSGVVTKQTATLNLKSGNLVSTLDPGRKSINNYGVRTPKGVAAARGTVYSVTVTQTGSSVATLSGTVTLTPVGGGTPIVIDIGSGMIVGADGNVTTTSLASLVQAEAAAGTGGAEGSMTNAVAAAVTAVTAAVANNSISSVTAGSTDAGTAVTVLAAVVNVASQANPSSAATFAQAAVTAVTAPTSAVATSGGSATQAAAAVTEAAVQGAVQTVVTQNAGNPAAAQAAAAAVTTSVTTAATNAATTSAASGGAQVDTGALSGAAATGATTGTTNANTATGANVPPPVTTPTAPPAETPTAPAAPVVVPPSTPITPVDPTVVSPSGG